MDVTDSIDSSDARRTDEELASRLALLDLDAKVRLLSGRDHWSTYAIPELGLRAMVLSDGTVGVRGVRWDESDPSLNLPSAPAIAASFDCELARELGRLVGADARRKGVDIILGPVVNLQRSPYGGRVFEAFSEDPWLTAQIAAAMAEGMQDEGRASVLKHFVANEAETDRLNTNSVLDERVLREMYLRPFAVAVEAGALGVMAAYNRVNGSRATESEELDRILRTEWGFDGTVVSDWGAVRTLEASMAGCVDLVMPGPRTAWSEGLAEAVRSGAVAEAAVDRRVERILRLAARLGALDGISALREDSSLPTPPLPDAPAVRQALRAAAARGTVLVRNEDETLPLRPAELRSLAVIGQAALAPRRNGGGSAAVISPVSPSPLDALIAGLPGVHIDYAVGDRPFHLVSTLTRDHAHSPDGRSAALLEFLADDGEVLGSEHRDRLDTLVYGMGYPDGVPAERVARIRATTRLSVAADGDYLLAGAGVGHLAIEVDRTELFDADLVPLNDDALIGMSLPPQAVVSVHLRHDEQTPVTVTYTPAAGTVAALRLGFDAVPPPPSQLVADAVRAARACEAAVVFVGTSAENEGEGFDRTSLRLPGRQDDLVDAVAAANPRTVVVVNAAAPVLMPWRERVAAIVLPWFGGQEMGPAVADVLTGRAEPGGRLPVTLPAEEIGLPSPMPVDGDVRYSEGLRLGYRAGAPDSVAYPFGHGLGYTEWSLDDTAVQADHGGVSIRVWVANVGERKGRQVVQAYLSRPGSSVARAALWYAGCAVCEVAAGAGAEVSIRIPRRLFEHWDALRHAWALEPGEFTVRVGFSSAHLAPGTAVSLPGG